MRVITGSAKGRTLITPKSNRIRPTSSRIKEALFSIIGDDVIGCTFIDGFSGTGNIGIEALSRGAKTCLFIENHKESISIIKKNLLITNFLDKSTLLVKNFIDGIKYISSQNINVDIIFLDPPYIKGLIEPALFVIIETNLLNISGMIIVEHDKNDIITVPKGIVCLMERKYGNTILSFYGLEEIK